MLLNSFHGFPMNAVTNVIIMATDVQDTALLNMHVLRYHSRRGVIQNLGKGVGIIVQKHER